MLKRWLKEFIIEVVCSDVTIGGHCGCCGVWVERVIVSVDWPWTLCENCIKEGKKGE